jgi:hypothetical protein
MIIMSVFRSNDSEWYSANLESISMTIRPAVDRFADKLISNPFFKSRMMRMKRTYHGNVNTDDNHL